VLQQQDAQLEQTLAVRQFSQDVSEQPQVRQAAEEYEPKDIGRLGLKAPLGLFP
jgi:hypothetical protein